MEGRRSSLHIHGAVKMCCSNYQIQGRSAFRRIPAHSIYMHVDVCMHSHPAHMHKGKTIGLSIVVAMKIAKSRYLGI